MASPRSVLILLAASLLLPLAAQAGDRCGHSAPRDLDLDLTGVKTVVFQIGAHTLRVEATKGAAAAVSGRACASSAALLPKLTVNRQRSGDTLRVELKNEQGVSFWGVNRYAYLDLRATLPDTIAVQVDIGSGDAFVSGVASLAGDVGSGDLQVRDVRGTFYADVGSGDIQAERVGALHVVSVGSGDLAVRDVRGDVRIGDVGSGDLTIVGARGKVEAGEIGSGDVSLQDIGGDVHLARVGSGDFHVDGARGDLTVDHAGSGSVLHRNIAGRVRVPTDH